MARLGQQTWDIYLVCGLYLSKNIMHYFCLHIHVNLNEGNPFIYDAIEDMIMAWAS